MCSIIGFEKLPAVTPEIAAAFAQTKNRGPDMTRWKRAGEGLLGFHRLAIMGLEESGMQPFAYGDSLCICNGELYGFRQMREQLILNGYYFASDSDCEIILPLYHSFGEDMFSMLDAEFAMILYDGEFGGLVAARDPIGIRPLFYGRMPDGSMAFASEAKSLIPLCARVMPFPPGCFWKGGKFTRYADAAAVESYVTDDLDTVCKNIREKLIAGVEKRLDSDAPLGFLLSGGLDSSLVCAISQRLLGKPIRTFSVGMEKDAIDLKYARQAADYIGSEHMEFYMTAEDIIAELDNLISVQETYDITTIRAGMGMYMCCKAIHQNTDVRVLLTGEISDELFGYKYTDFAPTPEEFQGEAVKRVSELYMYDVLRADRCISANSIEARVPFGDLEFVKYVMSIAP